MIERWDMEDAVFQFGVEKAGFGPDSFPLAIEETILVIFVCWKEGNVVEHPAEMAIALILGKFAGG